MSIVELFYKLRNGGLSLVETNKLLASVYNISYSYLKLKAESKPEIYEPGLDLKEMAIESTALLFRKNGTNRILLNEKLSSHSERINSRAELIYYINRIVRETTDRVVEFELIKRDLIRVGEGTN